MKNKKIISTIGLILTVFLMLGCAKLLGYPFLSDVGIVEAENYPNFEDTIDPNDKVTTLEVGKEYRVFCSLKWDFQKIPVPPAPRIQIKEGSTEIFYSLLNQTKVKENPDSICDFKFTPSINEIGNHRLNLIFYSDKLSKTKKSITYKVVRVKK